tara:strand:- start:350 stop:652 length:303 start_codon:yes stop_codon:yes gene_type:complete
MTLFASNQFKFKGLSPSIASSISEGVDSITNVFFANSFIFLANSILFLCNNNLESFAPIFSSSFTLDSSIITPATKREPIRGPYGEYSTKLKFTSSLIDS